MSKKIEIGPYSAYAIAVKHGYTGTEEQWVNETNKNMTLAQAAATDAQASKEAAEASKSAAAQSANESADSATAAQASEVAAASSENNAQASAEAAAKSAEEAKSAASTDTTLSVEGAPADAKIVGEKLDTKADKTTTEETLLKKVDKETICHAIPGTSSASWIFLGTLTNTDDADILIIDVYSGEGFNANIYQNFWSRTFIKDSFQNSDDTTLDHCYGVKTWSSFPEYHDAYGSFQVHVRGTKSSIKDGGTCGEVWLYFPFGYFNGFYSVSGTMLPKWKDVCQLQSSEPTNGTYQNTSRTAIPLGDWAGNAINSLKLNNMQLRLQHLNVGNGWWIPTCNSEYLDYLTTQEIANLNGTCSTGTWHCRLTDGTQICWGMFNNIASGSWCGFEMAFVSEPCVTITTHYSVSNGSSKAAWVYDVNTTGFRLGSPVSPVYVRYVALGRWC